MSNHRVDGPHDPDMDFESGIERDLRPSFTEIAAYSHNI